MQLGSICSNERLWWTESGYVIRESVRGTNGRTGCWQKDTGYSPLDIVKGLDNNEDDDHDDDDNNNNSNMRLWWW